MSASRGRAWEPPHRHDAEEAVDGDAVVAHALEGAAVNGRPPRHAGHVEAVGARAHEGVLGGAGGPRGAPDGAAAVRVAPPLARHVGALGEEPESGAPEQRDACEGRVLAAADVEGEAAAGDAAAEEVADLRSTSRSRAEATQGLDGCTGGWGHWEWRMA